MKIHKPPMMFKDEAAKALWEESLTNNQDDYGNAVHRYASEWATRMEAKLANGEVLKSFAKALSREADDEGITGYMYGAAVLILAACWKHGEELRRWHNLDIQLRDEGERANESGGVLNPAMMNIKAN